MTFFVLVPIELCVIGKSAGDCLFIDDSLENVEQARSLGFEVIHFITAEKLEQELCKRNFLCS